MKSQCWLFLGNSLIVKQLTDIQLIDAIKNTMIDGFCVSRLVKINFSECHEFIIINKGLRYDLRSRL